MQIGNSVYMVNRLDLSLNELLGEEIMKKTKLLAAVVAVAALGVVAPAAALAESPASNSPTPEITQMADGGVITPFDANVRDGWAKLHLTGYPSGWQASFTQDIPGGMVGHWEISGPNGYYWNTPDVTNPWANANGTGAGWVCGKLWGKLVGGGYQLVGNPCAKVY